MVSGLSEGCEDTPVTSIAAGSKLVPERGSARAPEVVGEPVPSAVVATNVGGISDLLTDEETALLVPDDDDEAMASAVARLLQDPELAGRVEPISALPSLHRHDRELCAKILFPIK